MAVGPKFTVVLLPGLNGTSGLFQPLIDCAPDAYDVLTITYPTHEKQSYSELTCHVLEKLCDLTNPYILLGESFSGPLALMVSQSSPEGLVGVVLVASFIEAPNLKAGRFLPWTIGFTLAKPLYSIRSALSRPDNKGFIQAISRELERVSPNVLADRIQSIFSVEAHTALKECPVPIMYFRGKKDFIVPEKNLKNIVHIRPDISIAYFETQHFLLQSMPEKAWQEIDHFIEGL